MLLGRLELRHGLFQVLVGGLKLNREQSVRRTGRSRLRQLAWGQVDRGYLYLSRFLLVQDY